MGRNKKLSFKSLFKKPNPKPFSSCSTPSSSSHFSWPSCRNPRTLSFRLLSNSDSSSSTADDSGSFSTATSSWSVEAVMQAKKSNRLHFDACSSQMKKRRVVPLLPLEWSVAVELDSEDVYGDFRISMMGMVDAYVKEGGREVVEMMEEMLEWFLRVNKKVTHEVIIRVYWDFMLEMKGNSCILNGGSASTLSSPISSDSYFSCLTDFEDEERG